VRLAGGSYGVGRARAAGGREERLTGGPPLAGTVRAHELRARAGRWERGGEPAGPRRWSRPGRRGKRAARGRRERETGPSGGKEKVGPVCWVGLGLGFPISYFFPLFYFKHHSNLFEFKSNLNSNSYALKQLKLMHQHECTNKLALK